MKLSAYFHPLAFSIYPILFLYSVNLEEMHFLDAAVPAFVSLSVAALLLLLLVRLFRDREKSALIVTGFCFAFFAYGAFDDLLISIVDHQGLRNFWFPVFWFIAFLVGAFAVLRSHEKLDGICSFLNVMALVMLLLVTGNIAWFHMMVTNVSKAGQQNISKFKVDMNLTGKPLPDIYYLIFDGYARQDVLKETYGADNSEFIGFLAEKGFFVASQSFANYPQTYLSLASSMNFDYLDALASQLVDQNTVQPLIEMINNNQLFAILRQCGYTTISLASGYSGTELRSADRYLSRNLLGREFMHTLANTTFLAALKLPFFDLAVSQADVHRARIRQTLQSLPSVKLPEGPAIIFAHITCPHPPFVFGPDGEALDTQERFHILDGSHWGDDTDLYRRQYRDQLKYFNRLVQEAFSKLLKDTSRQRIIVIQSDHGPGSGLNWQNVDKTDLRERFAILNAIYFENRAYNELYAGISPVNTFRVVLNQLLEEKMPLLPDRNYFAPWIGRYRFVDVTKRLLLSPH